MYQFNMDIDRVQRLNAIGNEQSNRFTKLTEEMGEMAEALQLLQRKNFCEELIDVTIMVTSIYLDHFPGEALDLLLQGVLWNPVHSQFEATRIAEIDDRWKELNCEFILRLQVAMGRVAEHHQIVTQVGSSKYKDDGQNTLGLREQLVAALAHCYNAIHVNMAPGHAELTWADKMDKWERNLTGITTND